MKKVFIYVQHLLGTGHLHRISAISDALSENGFNVVIANGGLERPQCSRKDIRIIDLPGVRSDMELSRLYDSDGNEPDQRFLQRRMELLLESFRNEDPDVLILESYPFGRRKFRFELIPLLELANNRSPDRPTIACSVRDVIQPVVDKKRVEEVVSTINAHFDYVFVHGEREIIPFEQTFPAAAEFSDRIVYTGYVGKPGPVQQDIVRECGRILVSAGGGAAGERLYRAAVGAAGLTRNENLEWHILVGQNLPGHVLDELLQECGDNVEIERNRPDFLSLLGACELSVSQGGYNTMMDLMKTGTPAIVIPFEGSGELEQITRAERFQKMGLVSVLREVDLDADNLADSVVAGRCMQVGLSDSFPLDGGARIARLLEGIAP